MKWLRMIESAEAFASLPFEFGTSMCLGRRIAELELHLVMARIVQQFDISYPTRYVLRVCPLSNIPPIERSPS